MLIANATKKEEKIQEFFHFLFLFSALFKQGAISLQKLSKLLKHYILCQQLHNTQYKELNTTSRNIRVKR
jgi:hypothetical protein